MKQNMEPARRDKIIFFPEMFRLISLVVHMNQVVEG